MAAAAVMMENSPSSLLGGELTGNQAERPTGESKPETSDLASNSSVKTDDASKKYEDKEQEEEPDTSTKSPSEKSSFSETTKKPPRMSSVDDYTMLPEGYVPKDEDVICSWARQNVSRSEPWFGDHLSIPDDLTTKAVSNSVSVSPILSQHY